MEDNIEVQHCNNIKEEIDNDDVEEVMVGCDNISPKQCQKLQFSIAQIMGFEGKEGDGKVDIIKTEEDADREDQPNQPVKLWRPLAQSPAAGVAARGAGVPGSGGISPSPGYGSEPASPGYPPVSGSGGMYGSEAASAAVPGPGPAALALLRHYTFFR